MELLATATAENTNKAYESAWRDWMRFLARNDDKNVSLEALMVIAECDRKGQAFSTINLKKSAVSQTYLAMAGRQLSREVIVQTIMKGI